MTCSQTRLWGVCAGLVLFSASGLAQSYDPAFTVRRTGDVNSSEGSCTIRVRIDNEADVELQGDQVRIRALSGSPGRDDGSECNQPLPRGGVTNFRFKGVDGRGEVNLLEAPSSRNGWRAVVRIRDSKGGDEGYTYRLTWNSTGAYSDDRYTTQNDRYDRRADRAERRADRLDRRNDRYDRQSDVYNNGSTRSGSLNLSQTGRGTLRGPNNSMNLERAYVTVQNGRDAVIRFDRRNGRAIEFRGDVRRWDERGLDIDLRDSDDGRVTGTARVDYDGRNTINSLQLDGNSDRGRFQGTFNR